MMKFYNGGSTADAWISPESYVNDSILDAAKITPYAASSILSHYCNASTLYNRMLSKVLGYQLNGFIWYQGEANAKIAENYETIFTGLIKDWRHKWNDDSLPFIFAQLSSYKPTDDPEGDKWAFLREAQLNTWKNSPNTAMVVTIDVGEIEDIHPKNKKTVGARFSAAAKKLVYGKNIESSGPIFSNISFQNNQAILSFDHAENGLESVETSLSEFEICGDDYLYEKAEAKIEDGKIIVWNDVINDPKAVRYAWRNGPEPTLYNVEGFPASPFRSMIEPVAATSHIPFTDFKIYSSASYVNRDAKYAFNGAGLNSDGQTHSNAVNTVAWMSSVGNAYPYYLKVQFNEAEKLDKIKIWNLNWASYLFRGIKDFDMYYSISTADLSEIDFTDSRWIKYDEFILPMADGTNSYLGESFSLDLDEHVTWFAINIRSCYGDLNGYVGISEVQFFRGNVVSLEENRNTKRMMIFRNNGVIVDNTLDTDLNFELFYFSGYMWNHRKIGPGETTEIVLDSLPKNVYLFSLRSEKYHETQKIMIQ